MIKRQDLFRFDNLQVIIVQKKSPRPTSPSRNDSSSAPAADSLKPAATKKPSHLRLVSYNDDNAVSDGDADESDEDTIHGSAVNQDAISMDISEEDGGSSEPRSAHGGADPSQHATDATSGKPDASSQAKRDKATEYGFQLPAEPKGKCPPELQEKITNMHAKMKQGMDMNRLIQDRKEFRNPSIYEKLIQFCDINELGTNYPPEIYDPLQWGTARI